MNLSSVKTRFIVSVVANAGRAGVSFLTGVLIARVLSPIGYGDLFFLLGSFTAIRVLMDMGTSQAFYTFIAQGSKPRSFYLLYFAWLALQFIVAVLLLIVILPETMIDRMWLGHTRDVILLAFLASFLQQQVWTTVIQVCEAVRMTVLVQLFGLAIVIIHLCLVLFLMWMDKVSINTVLIILFSEYMVATIIVLWFFNQNLKKFVKLSDSKEKFKDVLFEYWNFCQPLIIIAVVSFFYEFLDRWMLQRFGGSEQQGFYQISVQFSAISMLATASILNIFWKEIAEAYEQNNNDRMEKLFHKVSRSLLMLGATIACFLIPWSEQLTILLLGDDYTSAWPILMVMFFYPIHQSIGQINATMFMACKRTKPYMHLTLISMFVSMPVTYILLVSSGDWYISGLGLGAFGLAIKMVSLNILFVNIQSWVLARFHGWKYEWGYQLEGIIFLLSLGFISQILIVMILGEATVTDTETARIWLQIVITGILYLIGILVYAWVRPSLFGLKHNDVLRALNFVIRKINVKHAN